MQNNLIDLEKISVELDKNGFYILDQFISSSILNKIKKELNLWNFKFNSNELSPVINNYSYFYSNAMASSETLFDLICSEFVFNISKKYLGSKFRLKAHRVYQLQKNYVFPWHTDNKSVQIKNNSKGIVFIIYMNDTFEGETQLIKGSHKYSSQYKNSNIAEGYVNKKYKNDIISIKAKRGSIVIFDQSIIHRGKPIKNKNVRNAIFFQIDTNLDDAEKLILNNSYIKSDIISNRSQFLGLGLKSTFPVSPDNTSFKTLPFMILLKIFISIPYYFIYFLYKTIRKRISVYYKKYY